MGVLNFVFLCLVAFSVVDAASKHQHVLQRTHQNRQVSGYASTTIMRNGASFNVNSSGTPDLGIEVVINDVLILVYRKDVNALAIVNTAFNFFAVIDGINQILGIFCKTTGAALLISLKTRLGLVVSGTGPLTGFNAVESIVANIPTLINLIKTKKDQIVATTSVAINQLIPQLAKSLDLSGITNGNTLAPLGDLLSTVRSLLINGVTKVSSLAAALLAPTIGLGVNVASPLLTTGFNLINSIVNNLLGAITMPLINVVNEALRQVGTSLDSLNRIVNGLTGINGLYDNLNTALEAVSNLLAPVFTIKEMIINGVIYLIQAAITIIGRWVFRIVSLVLNITLSIIYDVVNNVLAIVNQKVKLSLVLPFSLGYIVVINVNAGSYLLINSPQTSVRYVSENASDILNAFGNGVNSLIGAIIASIKSISGSVFSGPNTYTTLQLLTGLLALKTKLEFDVLFAVLRVGVSLITEILRVVFGVFTAVSALLTRIVNLVIKILANLGASVKQILIEAFDSLLQDSLSNFATNTLDTLTGTIGQVVDGVVGAVGGVVGAVGGVVGAVGNILG